MARILMLPVVTVILAVSAAGCAHEPDRDLERLPAYNAGYSDGCRTAQNRARGFATKTFKHDDAFAQDAAYRAGWREASMICGNGNGLTRNRMFDDQQIGPARL
ncbi:MAG: hypothetical protein ACFB0Z_04810 [Candidatus Phaeomarinobacter sp.]|mgnify:CR=1 FL=1